MKVYLLTEWIGEELMDYLEKEGNNKFNTYSVAGIFSSWEFAEIAMNKMIEEPHMSGAKYLIEPTIIDAFSTGDNGYSIACTGELTDFWELPPVD